jgi:hypothetical protein
METSTANSEGDDQRQWWRSPKATAILVISLAVVGAAQRDIHKRPSGEIRGSKLLWRLVSFNALGAAAYLKWGRRAD